jgi:Acyl-CoA carboxylase epsilon subunit
MSDAASTPRPALRIVKGDPTPEELAVLTAVVAASGGKSVPASRERRGGWNDPMVLHRREIVQGPNAWRAASW